MKKQTAGKKVEKIKKSGSRKKIILFSVISTVIILLVAAGISIYFYGRNLLDPTPVSLTQEQEALYQSAKQEQYPEKLLNSLPYGIIPADLTINAKSAIVIDTSNGCVLYEKNADELIPPASLTKLVVMYVVEQEINTGRISYSDVVPLPPESWAVNQPADSSLMFLAEGQTVTLDELLQGLAVCSGNDAAYAIASYVSGSMEAFLERMNLEVQKLGLTQTHFVEPSGYSEKNVTTAREFAAFARAYIYNYPESIPKYHSLMKFSYPMSWNLPENFDRSSIPADKRQFYLDSPWTWTNTNKTLGVIPGADGLKTGYIDESGYNLAYTVKRGDSRFLSITLGGPGSGSVQGNKYRVEDAQTITDFCYSTFTSVRLQPQEDIPVIAAGGKEEALYLKPTGISSLTVPHLAGADISNDGSAAEIRLDKEVVVPAYITAPVKAGEKYGEVVYSLNGTVLCRVPLIADRNIDEAWAAKGFMDSLLLNYLTSDTGTIR